MVSKKHYLVLALIGVLFIAFSSSVFVQGTFEELSITLSGYLEGHGILGPVVFVLLAAASVLLGPFTSTPLLPFAVAVWGTDRTLLLLMAGWLIGNTIAYFIGLYIGHPLIKKFYSESKFSHWTKMLSRKIDIPLALLFRLATPSETGYVFGTIKYNFFKYFFVTFIAELPFAIVAIYASEAFVNAGWKTFAALGTLWLVIIYLAIRLLNKRLDIKV